jgi:hypothetical protein
VVHRRVEVGVVADGRREDHVELVLAAQRLRSERLVVPERGLVRVEQAGERRARLAPRRPPEREQPVQRLPREGPLREMLPAEQPGAVQAAQVERPIADGDEDARGAARPGPTHPVGQVLDREVALRIDRHERRGLLRHGFFLS